MTVHIDNQLHLKSCLTTFLINNSPCNYEKVQVVFTCWLQLGQCQAYVSSTMIIKRDICDRNLQLPADFPIDSVCWKPTVKITNGN